MELLTKIRLHPAGKPISYTSEVLLTGSCFATNIGQKLDYFQFRSVQNPLGILYHPLAISNLLERAAGGRWFTGDDVFLFNERWHCFEAHSELSASTSASLVEALNERLRLTRRALGQCSHIFITLGTARTYRHKASGQPVANCHKRPGTEFTHELTPVAELTDLLMKMVRLIRSLNKGATLIFTVF